MTQQQAAADWHRIRQHWESETCGVRYGDNADEQLYFQEIRERRHELEPYIRVFQDAPGFLGKKVLEIGVGAGSDFLQWVEAGANPIGLDFTYAAVKTTRRHLVAAGKAAFADRVLVADAEALPFPDEAFDLVYAFGVVHHSADTERAVREARRVLKPGGRVKLMVYHAHCWTGWMLWLRYGLLQGRPWQSPRAIIFEHLESPGTKSFTVAEAKRLVESAGFRKPRVWTQLGPGDLLQVRRSARYQSAIYSLVWRIYPRWLVKMFGNRFGCGIFIDAEA